MSVTSSALRSASHPSATFTSSSPNRRGTVLIHAKPFDGLQSGVVVVEGIWPNGLRYLWTDAFGLVLLVFVLLAYYPFRRHDGVIIIDHGRGWMTLMTGVRPERRKGERVKAGEPLGRALGSMTVELSTNGTPVSAALIASSSQMVSNNG